MTKRIAVISGVSSQDGAYLAQFLMGMGYVLFGTSRDAQGSSSQNLLTLGNRDQVHCLSMVPEDIRSALVDLQKSNPDEIYYLVGQSSVGLSFEQSAETMQRITLGTLNIFESCRIMKKKIRLYQAGSSECFSDTHGEPANEKTPFYPMSLYAVAKSSAFWLVRNYRDAYSLFSCTDILFNNESSLGPERIAAGSAEKLTLGIGYC